ncbi:uncharacterized protein LOC113520674 [Galleria mellonella]|uniref:Uncharacterized protein LOC113520674 n=1 Tax=Galleria mellonella TaxID=7137 RepID=A0A6J1WZJ2_GALME|nr:uncharacterized protein LOC113520674 [Galleria mellonella]
MVRITTVLSRIPVIKFRKGGVGQSAGGSTIHASAQQAAAPQSQAQPTAAMSTGPILDIDLPARYRRRPLSQEEIDYINGGGIV